MNLYSHVSPSMRADAVSKVDSMVMVNLKKFCWQFNESGGQSCTIHRTLELTFSMPHSLTVDSLPPISPIIVRFSMTASNSFPDFIWPFEVGANFSRYGYFQDYRRRPPQRLGIIVSRSSCVILL